MESQLFPNQKALAPARKPISQVPLFNEGCMSGAEAGTRTPTPEGTAPSRQRVYQFHHFGTKNNAALVIAFRRSLPRQLGQPLPKQRALLQ